MTWTAVAQGADEGKNGGANEDLVAVHAQGGITDIVVLDGGSAVAERDYIDSGIGDVAWFVRRFAATLASRLDPVAAQASTVAAAVAAVRADYLAGTAEDPAPVHAWPIAALTWARVRAGTLDLFCLGDCKTLLRLPDGDVRDLDAWVNPQEGVLQRALATLPVEPIARKAGLLPLLRARREAQNLAPAPSILCTQPQGPFAARRHTVTLTPGASLLVMTDGFYRLVDPYDLYSPRTLFDACRARGLDAMLAELRAFEAAGTSDGRAVKAADDASAVLWTAQAGTEIPHDEKEQAWRTASARP